MYRAYWRFTTQSSVHVVYAKENGLLTWTGGSKGHYRAFLVGSPMQELPSEDAPAPARVPSPLPKSKSAARRRKLLERDGDGCWFCGLPMGDDCTIEHLIPKSKGGRDWLANYALAHSKCNASAADLPLVQKIAMRARLRGEIA
jgi:5-methylcytosine-specific restriction endonuclease McrA